MVPAACDVEEQIRPLDPEDGSHNCDVRQMGAAVIGRIEHEDVALTDLAPILPNDRFDTAIHRA